MTNDFVGTVTAKVTITYTVSVEDVESISDVEQKTRGLLQGFDDEGDILDSEVISVDAILKVNGNLEERIDIPNEEEE